MFILPNRFFFLEFQIWHYKERLAVASDENERCFLAETLYNLQQSLATIYN